MWLMNLSLMVVLVVYLFIVRENSWLIIFSACAGASPMAGKRHVSSSMTLTVPLSFCVEVAAPVLTGVGGVFGFTIRFSVPLTSFSAILYRLEALERVSGLCWSTILRNDL